MWECVVKCAKPKEHRKEFVTNLMAELIKNKNKDVNTNEVFEMIEDTL